MNSRRNFLKKLIILGGMITIRSEAGAAVPVRKPLKEPLCTLFRSVNGSPEDNLRKVIELAGGIEGIVGHDDVVIIKPNVQWWNQGAPNLSALKTFVELIMERRGGFRGEVIIAENCHRGQYPSTSMGAGWALSFERNADIAGVNNMNELSALLKRKYRDGFSLCHWLDISCGGKRVFKPADGPGYVYCDGTGGVPLISCDNGRSGPDHRATIMTYPIFTTDRGTVVDFKHGVWEKGSYTDQRLRVINFAALNHHSTYCGMTSAVKNYMGITDLSGGPDPHNNGRLTGDYYNFHSFPFNKWAPGPESGMLGKAIGTFMKTIRKADLNITTAEWVGLTSRTDPPVAQTRGILASTEPVALDYHAAKYVLYPNSRLMLHNPDNTEGPLHQYLKKCAEACGGYFDEGKVRVLSYDLRKGNFQNDLELAIIGEKVWGGNFRAIMKYLYLRFAG
jgi:hypothetical protein